MALRQTMKGDKCARCLPHFLREKRNQPVCVLWSNCGVLSPEQFNVFVNTKFICLLFLYRLCFSASWVRSTFFRSVFGASFPLRSLVVPWVARVHDPFWWLIGVGARLGSLVTQIDWDKKVESAQRVVHVWHFVLTKSRGISGNQEANLAPNLEM